MTPSEIRATIRSLWLNSLEAELLGSIVLALADVLECLEDIRRGLLLPGDCAGVSRDNSDARQTVPLRHRTA